MTAEPTKIKIRVLDERYDGERELTVQFNPPDYRLSKGSQIAEIGIPGIDSPLLQFIRGTNEKLVLKLFFDTTDSGADVRDDTEKFYKLAKINRHTHALPRCMISWGETGALKGDRTAFTGIVESIDQNFTLFKPNGIPIRAELELSFREYRTLKEQIRELRSYTRRRVIKEGDTLSGIAAEEYNDPGEWRRIADKNRIFDPRMLTPGQAIEIPPED